jgi:hypothetical protein
VAEVKTISTQFQAHTSELEFDLMNTDNKREINYATYLQEPWTREVE